MELRRLAFGIATSAALLACKDPQAVDQPRITVTPGALVFGAVELGGEDRVELYVESTGDATLRVFDIEVETNTGYVRLDDGTSPALELDPGDGAYISFVYSPVDPAQTEGRVVFTTNDPEAARLEIDIETPIAAPFPNIAPAILDFGVVGVESDEVITARLRNVGFAPLIVCRAEIVGSPEFTSNLGEVLAASADPTAGHVVVAALGGEGGGVGLSQLDIELHYAPIAPGDDVAELVLEFDRVGDVANACAAGNTESESYEISGSAGTPLLERDPCPLDFGERATGVTHEESVSLVNLGELPLTIFDIRVDPTRTAPAFGLRDLPAFPLTLEPDFGDAFTVVYRPETLIAESGVILIDHTNATGDRVLAECSVAGVGSDNARPVALAVGSILQDLENRRGNPVDWALPIQTLLLDGAGSYDPDGDELADYFWDVVRAPDVAVGGIEPYDADPSPEFGQYFIPVAGRYEFCLTVTDASGAESEPDCVDVVAVPGEAISVELTWATPADPDPVDDTGSDLDLHFVKMPSAWFDRVYDAFYANPAPTWSPEHPSLDIDDTDGLGPETTQLNDPESCTWYAVGVHYFRERYGTVWPTVRIFINGRLVDEQVNRPLNATDDFWDVARIHWPSGSIYRADGFFEGFSSADGIAPQPTDAMRASGLCGVP